MQYRKFGKLDFEVSALGFGCMRLPLLKKTTQIDEKETARMFTYAIDQGINYFDTAYVYHEGQSEPILGKILKETKLRHKVKIATKLPCWMVEKKSDLDKFLNEQLKKLQVEQIDFYLLHALFSERWAKIYSQDIFTWAEKAIKEGKIAYLGFSFHDNYDQFKEIIDAYDGWDLCQIQYNYMNENVQAGIRGLKYAAQKGIAVVVMEPLLGGLLANPPPSIKKYWDKVNYKPVDLALRWLWNQPEVSVVLSGMSTYNQITENLESANNSGINALSEYELSFINDIKKKYRAANPIPCTKCRYCMPCPYGVDIPRNLELYSEGIIYNQMEISKAHYNWHLPENKRASACQNCKTCEEKCPQDIDISDWMPKIHDALIFKSND